MAVTVAPIVIGECFPLRIWEEQRLACAADPDAFGRPADGLHYTAEQLSRRRTAWVQAREAYAALVM